MHVVLWSLDSHLLLLLLLLHTTHYAMLLGTYLGSELLLILRQWSGHLLYILEQLGEVVVCTHIVVWRVNGVVEGIVDL